MDGKQKSNIRPHEADGIQECDNQLPTWWVGLFIFTIVFGVIYIVRFHILGAPSLKDEYVAAMADKEVLIKDSANGGGNSAVPASKIESLVGNPEAIAAGKVVFDTNCVACHAADGGGGVGPNLTDNYFLHGGSPADIRETVASGVAEKGMIAWLPILGPAKVDQVAAFVISLKGTSPANPKEPQGSEISSPGPASSGASQETPSNP